MSKKQQKLIEEQHNYKECHRGCSIQLHITKSVKLQIFLLFELNAHTLLQQYNCFIFKYLYLRIYRICLF